MSHDPEIRQMLADCHRILKTLEEQTARASAPVVTPGVAQWGWPWRCQAWRRTAWQCFTSDPRHGSQIS